MVRSLSGFGVKGIWACLNEMGRGLMRVDLNKWITDFLSEKGDMLSREEWV